MGALLVSLFLLPSCSGAQADVATPPLLDDQRAEPRKGSSGKMDTRELVKSLGFDGTGEWYAFLKSGDAATLAQALASTMNQGRTSVLAPGDQSVEKLAPELKKHVIKPSLVQAGDRITLTFWFGMPPGFGPTQFVASAAPKGSATVTQKGLGQLLADNPGDQESLLLRQLESPERPSRVHAATELGKRKDARALPGLIKLLGDDVADARKAATLAIKAIGDRHAATALGAALKKESDAYAATEMVDTLAALGGADAKAALSEAALHHASDSVRKRAAYHVEMMP